MIKKVDIVYVLGTGSTHNNIELRASIASVKRHCINAGQIYVVGSDPGFTGDFIFIPAPDDGKNKNDRIRRKIEIACAIPELSETFLFINDDHFFNATVDISKLPYYYQHDLQHVFLNRRVKDSYRQAIDNTMAALRGYPTKHFDIHTPILYNKFIFLNVMRKYDWGLKDGFIIKSLYCNHLEIQGEQIEECLINNPPKNPDEILDKIEGAAVWSVAPGGMNDEMEKFLKSYYLSTKSYAG